MVWHLHILLRLISPDKQQGVATFVFWPRYICFRSSVFLICEAGLLNVVAETLCHVTLLLLFRCCRVSTSSLIREVCICNKFSLLKRLCDHVLHPLCSFARVLLMHMTVFKLLLGQVLMAIVSTSSPQFVILYCCKLLFQKLLKFEKMSYVIYLGQSYTF